MAVANLKIMIMNTNGRTEHRTIADERKQVICDVVKETGAALYLFQEFIWQDIRGNAWKGEYELPPQLVQIKNNKEACILFDKDEVTVENVPSINDIIQRSTLDRMCIRKVKTKRDPIFEFICISWHGRSTESVKQLIEDFEDMLKDISKLSEKLSLPVLLAGDFNLKTKDIETPLSSSSLVLHKYEPAKRRKSENIIDFFISSQSLEMSGTKALTLESLTKVAEVLKLFDHDPVVSFMSTKPENKDSSILILSTMSLSS